MTEQGARDDEAVAALNAALTHGGGGAAREKALHDAANLARRALLTRKHPEPEITGSASQRVTEVLGTDDWVIVHSGNELVTDAELDGMEVQR